MTRLTFLRSAVVALLLTTTSVLALHRPSDEVTVPQRPVAASSPPALAVDAGPQPVTDAAAPPSPPTTSAPASPPPTPTQEALPAAEEQPSKPPPSQPPSRPPSRPSPSAIRCARYDRGGSVHPLCTAGSAGAMNDVVVERVPGTNVVVNRAWTANLAAFFGAARAAGFNIQAYDVAGPGYGSYRTAAMQLDLRRRGYPANPPGLSMHEWGLAIDLSCNGVKFLDAPPQCREWVRANAGRFGIQNLPSEPWHWSTNGN